MENLKNVNEKKVENVVKTANVNEEVIDKTDIKETAKKFYLSRKTFSLNGEQYYSYGVDGTLRGRKVRADFIPKDKGGYEVLDIVFDTVDKVELVVGEETMQGNDGTKSRYTTYTARSFDSDGSVYECPVNPARPSDKALFKMLVNQK